MIATLLLHYFFKSAFVLFYVFLNYIQNYFKSTLMGSSQRRLLNVTVPSMFIGN